MSANWIDAILAAVLLLSVALATLRGFLYSILGVLSALLAFALALAQGGILIAPLNAILESPGVSAALSHAIVFVAALLAFSAVGKLIRGATRKLDLGGLDRFGGFLFGLLRGALIAVVAVLVIGALPVENSGAWKNSALVPAAGGVAFLFLGQGGMLETKLWEFDERRRPALNYALITPAALKSASRDEEDSEDAKSESETESELELGLESIPGLNLNLDLEKPPCAESEDRPCAE